MPTPEFHRKHTVIHLYEKETMDQDRDLVVLKFKEEKESLESYFNSLASRVDTIQTTQTEEVSQSICYKRAEIKPQTASWCLDEISNWRI